MPLHGICRALVADAVLSAALFACLSGVIGFGLATLIFSNLAVITTRPEENKN